LNRNEDWKGERFPFCSIRHSGHERAVQLGHIYIIKDRVQEAIFCSDMYISALHYYAQLNNQISSFLVFLFYPCLCVGDYWAHAQKRLRGTNGRGDGRRTGAVGWRHNWPATRSSCCLRRDAK
jgi:hypothetical protein